MKFENPQNGYAENSGGALSWLWVLLFAPIYWAVKGVWRHVFVSIVLALCTFGISQLIYPFFTYSILKNHYRRNGWQEVQK